MLRLAPDVPARAQTEHELVLPSKVQLKRRQKVPDTHCVRKIEIHPKRKSLKTCTGEKYYLKRQQTLKNDLCERARKGTL